MEQVASKPTPFADHHDDAASKAQQDGGKSFVVARAPYFIIIKKKRAAIWFFENSFPLFPRRTLEIFLRNVWKPDDERKMTQ